MEISYALLYGFILSIQFALGVILFFNYKKVIKHYFWEFWWTFLLQIVAFVFINDWLMVKHPLVYSNTSENDMNQGLIEIEGKDLSRSALLQVGVLFPLSLHCLYAASRRVLFEKGGKRVKYDPSIKWIEYMISSTFQTAVLYSLYGQIGQTIWVAGGLKMFSMFSAYGFEKILLKKSETNYLINTLENYTNIISDLEEVILSKNSDSKSAIKNLNKNHEEILQNKFKPKLLEKFKLNELTDLITDSTNRLKNNNKDLEKKFKKLKPKFEDTKNEIKENIEQNQTDLQNQDIIAKAVMKQPEVIIIITFFIYSAFHYGPLFVFADERPEWVQAFLAGMILNDVSFPLTMIIYKKNLASVRVDIIYSIWSLVSKNTFDLIIVLGTKRVSNYGVILMIPASLIAGFILYYFMPKPKKSDNRPYYSEKILIG